MFIEDCNEDKFDSVYDSVYRFLKKQKEELNDYTLKDMEKFLESQYVYDGNNLLGRSELKHISIQATIAACETVIEEWKDELAATPANP